MLEPALLYVYYHRYVPQLDALIEQQARQTGAPLAVTFADEAIADLVRGGFTEERAARFFALFFQLRRAFFSTRIAHRRVRVNWRLRESL